GELVIVGDEPDGNAVRFRADEPSRWARIEEQRRPVKLSADGTARLRFEGVDAPEAWLGGTAQPLGVEVSEALLARLGFRGVADAARGIAPGGGGASRARAGGDPDPDGGDHRPAGQLPAARQRDRRPARRRVGGPARPGAGGKGPQSR